MEIPYLKPIFVVFAAIGIHLIEPFYSRTIEQGATHSQLKVFYKQLYVSMETPVTGDFFKLEKPKFDGVSKEWFEGVKKSYTKEVVDAISESGTQYEEHCVKPANFIMPELRTVLARQRRDYGISEEFKAEFPVEKQASNPDDTPVNNISMERNLGTVDYRLQKLRTLEAVSRSVILDKNKRTQRKVNGKFEILQKGGREKGRDQLEVEQENEREIFERFGRKNEHR